MSDHTRRKGEDDGGTMATPGGPKAPADAVVPSDPIPDPPGRSAGGHGAEVQVPLASPEKEVGTPGREAPSPEVGAGADRRGGAADDGKPSFLGAPSDYPIPRGTPDGEP